MANFPKRRDRASAIIIRDSRILLIYRKNREDEYYVIPGGGIEADETPEQTVLREIQEETGLTPVVGALLYEGMSEARNQYQYYFSCNLPDNQEPVWQEEFKQTKNNVYRFEWVEINKLPAIPLKPDFTKDLIRANSNNNT